MTDPLLPNILGIDADHLALVHTADKRPGRDALGNLVIDTAFNGAGGYDQDSASGEGARLRQTLHFSLQSAVSDHVYGSFQGRPFFVVAPLMHTLAANGRPESLLTSDVAFFPDQGRMRFPSAVLVEMDSTLPGDTFAIWENDVLRVSPVITSENLDQARKVFAGSATSGVDTSPLQSALASENATHLSPAAVVDLALGLALARIGAPSLNAAIGQDLGAPMGFDGWIDPQQLNGLADYINDTFAGDGMGRVHIGRHSGMPGDRLFCAVGRSNAALINEVLDDTTASQRVREAAKAWQGSEFLEKTRQTRILDEIINGSDKLSNDHGVERTGLTRTLFGSGGFDRFEHPTIGTVGRGEVEHTLFLAEPGVIAQIKQSLERRGMVRRSAEQAPHPADESLVQWMTENCPNTIKGFSQERVDARRRAHRDAPSQVPTINTPAGRSLS